MNHELSLSFSRWRNTSQNGAVRGALHENSGRPHPYLVDNSFLGHNNDDVSFEDEDWQLVVILGTFRNMVESFILF